MGRAKGEAKGERGRARRGRAVGEAAGAPASGLLRVHALRRGDLLLATLGALAALALYARTAAPTLYSGDSAELAAAAAVLGVPHPPGYPLYTLATGALVRLLPVADAARAANLASGLYAAAALAALLLALRRLGVPRPAALFASAALGVGTTWWEQATVAEVYTFDLLLLFATVHAALSLGARARAAASPPSSAAAGTAASAPVSAASSAGAPLEPSDAAQRARAWLVLGLCAGSWVGHRPVNLVYLPAVVVLLASVGGLARAARARSGPGALRAGGVLALGGILALGVYAWLPLASLRDPAIDVGDPETWERFQVVVSGAPYRRHLAGATAAEALGRVARFAGALPRDLGLAALLALVGLRALARGSAGERRLALALALVVGAGAGFAARYRVLDVEVYFLPAHAALALAAGLGAARLGAVRLGARLSLRLGRGVAAVLLVGAGLAHLPASLARCDRSWNTLPRRLGEDLLASAGGDALLVVQGDTSIHALGYLQAVEGRAPETIVVSPGHLHAWYAEELAARRPSEPWPAFDPRRSQVESARAILDALGPPRRRAFVSLAMPADELLGPRPGGAGGDAARGAAGGTAYGAVPWGLVQEALPYGTRYDRRERALANGAFLAERLARLPAIPAHVDMDAKSILLQYALAAARAAEELARLDEVAPARELFTAVVRLEPDRHERDVRADVRRGLGAELPLLRLGAQAERALAALVR